MFMGWLYMRDCGEYGNARSYLDNQFTFARDGTQVTCLASALVGGKAYYAAVEQIDPGGRRTVTGIVCLVAFNPRAADGMTFGYKDMDESMGPCEADCPDDILDLLTPTDREHALNWRARCRANNIARKAISARPTPRIGQTIIFDPPLDLSNGRTVARFTVIAPHNGGRGLRYRAHEGGETVRIPNVKNRPYRIINPAITPA